MRTFVIGDIHGCDTALLECLEAVSFDFEVDELISVGDLCDRGPDSYNVVEILMKIRNKVIIHGNHDLWFLEFMNAGELNPPYMQVPNHLRNWLVQGGQQTLDSYMNASKEDWMRHIMFYKSMPAFHVKNNICFVHGGFFRDESIYTQRGIDMAWNREFVEEMMSCGGDKKLKTVDGFKEIFIGHTPTMCWYEDVPGLGRQRITKPIEKGGVVNIDTGCGKGGKLTIWNLETREYYQTKGMH